MSKNIFAVCASIAFSLFSVSTSATQLKPLTLEQLAAAGEAVIHGVVTSKVCQRDSQGRIFTRVELVTKERWKGSRPVLSIVHAGGILGDEAAFADGQEHYDIGEEVVAFVRFNNRGEALTLGMNQGKFSVFKRDRETFVHNAFHGASPPELARPTGRKPLRLTDLKARVRGGAR